MLKHQKWVFLLFYVEGSLCGSLRNGAIQTEISQSNEGGESMV